MSSLRELPRKDFIILMISILIPCCVFGASFYQAYLHREPHTVSFKVFYTETQDRGGTQTQVLTYGVGKFYFIGNYTGQFQLDHNYTVTYVRSKGLGRHVYNDLIILEWREIV